MDSYQPLSEELRYLRNLIHDAESDVSIDILRKLIKTAADEATAAGVIRMAKTILQCGIELERGESN